MLRRVVMSGSSLGFGFTLQERDVVTNGGCGDEPGTALMDRAQAAGSKLFVDDGAAYLEHPHDVRNAVKLQGGRAISGHTAPPSVTSLGGVPVPSVPSSFWLLRCGTD